MGYSFEGQRFLQTSPLQKWGKENNVFILLNESFDHCPLHEDNENKRFMTPATDSIFHNGLPAEK